MTGPRSGPTTTTRSIDVIDAVIDAVIDGAIDGINDAARSHLSLPLLESPPRTAGPGRRVAQSLLRPPASASESPLRTWRWESASLPPFPAPAAPICARRRARAASPGARVTGSHLCRK